MYVLCDLRGPSLNAQFAANKSQVNYVFAIAHAFRLSVDGIQPCWLIFYELPCPLNKRRNQNCPLQFHLVVYELIMELFVYCLQSYNEFVNWASVWCCGNPRMEPPSIRQIGELIAIKTHIVALQFIRCMSRTINYDINYERIRLLFNFYWETVIT